MGVLSRYYTKQSLQKRMIGQANVEEIDESVAELYKEINNIKENIIVYTSNPNIVPTGFFGI